MSIIKQPFFVFWCIAYLLYYMLKHLGYDLPVFIRNYFSDFICLFLINGFALQLIRWMKGQDLELTVVQVIFSWACCSLLFEWVLPHQNPKVYTQDYWDVASYGVGAMMFILWRRNFRLSEGKP